MRCGQSGYLWALIIAFLAWLSMSDICLYCHKPPDYCQQVDHHRRRKESRDDADPGMQLGTSILHKKTSLFKPHPR